MSERTPGDALWGWRMELKAGGCTVKKCGVLTGMEKMQNGYGRYGTNNG
jgi:hypothetical protein